MGEPDENSEDKDKCLTLSPSDDDEDLSDEDGGVTGEDYTLLNLKQYKTRALKITFSISESSLEALQLAGIDNLANRRIIIC